MNKNYKDAILINSGSNEIKRAWELLKEGKDILINNQQCDELEDYIKTVTEEEQDNFYMNFRSLFVPQLQLGILSRCLLCNCK